MQYANKLAINKAKCPLCSNSNCRKMKVYTAILNLPGNIESNVYRCITCGAYFLWPYIADLFITELYRKSYFTGVHEKYDSCHIPSSGTDYEREHALARIDKFRKTLEVLHTYVPMAKNILDIGAATGEFLSIAREQGLSVTGIELSSYASARAKDKYGFDFHQVKIEDYNENVKYDLIHMNHVFEHIVFPHKVLKRINSLLSPEGMIYVEVPFQFSIYEVYKYYLTRQKKCFDAFSVHHPVFYRPSTLRKIFEAHGFKCRKIRVFDWSRYPVVGFKSRLKRLIWFGASLVGQGNIIEAFMDRSH